MKKPKDSRKKDKRGSETDTDFQAESEEDSEAEPVLSDNDAAKELGEARPRGAPTSKILSSTPKPPAVVMQRKPPPPFVHGGVKINLASSEAHDVPFRSTESNSLNLTTAVAPQPLPRNVKSHDTVVKTFQRVKLPTRSPLEPTYGSFSNHLCPACHKNHPQGACELKVAGVEHCGLCGLAHFGYSRTCPHIKSETQVREMLLALKSSPEKKELVEAAVKYLRGVKGTLVQQKKKDREKAEALKSGVPLPMPAIGRPPNPGQQKSQQKTFVAPPANMNGMPYNQVSASPVLAWVSSHASPVP